MAKKNVTVEDQNLENVQEALNTTTMWIEKNQKKLLMNLLKSTVNMSY